MPHARVKSIDTSAALAMPGVKGILTDDDLPGAQAGATLGEGVTASQHQRARLDDGAVVRGRADSGRRRRRRADRRRGDRENPDRVRTAALRRRPDRQPSAGRSERAHAGQRLDASAGDGDRSAGPRQPGGAAAAPAAAAAAPAAAPGASAQHGGASAAGPAAAQSPATAPAGAAPAAQSPAPAPRSRRGRRGRARQCATGGGAGPPRPEVREFKWTAEDFAAARRGPDADGRVDRRVDRSATSRPASRQRTWCSTKRSSASRPAISRSKRGSAMAYWQNGKLYLHGSTQSTVQTVGSLARWTGLDPNRHRADQRVHRRRLRQQDSGRHLDGDSGADVEEGQRAR